MGKFIRERGLLGFRKVLLGGGLAFSMINVLLLAPETGLGIPNSVYPVIIGVFLAGFAQGMAILPYISEMCMLVIKHYPTNLKRELTEKISETTEIELEEIKEKTGADYT